MGGRIGCHVSLEEKVDGLVCLGYPLCAMGDRTKLRDEVLRALTTPILFVQGTRDALCPLDLLERVRGEMKAPNFLHVVEGGDHSLRVPKRQLQATGETQEDVDQRILKSIADFVANCCRRNSSNPRTDSVEVSHPESDARTRRTPKAICAKCKDAYSLSRKLWECDASSHRFLNGARSLYSMMGTRCDTGETVDRRPVAGSPREF